MNKNQKNICYYHIRASIVWFSIVCLVTIIIVCYHRDSLYDAWMKVGGKENVTYVGLKSKLTDSKECYLCGNTDNSMMDYYRSFNTLGIISVNDWNILEFETKTRDESGTEADNHSGSRSSIGTTDVFQYEMNSLPSRGIAEVEIELSEHYKPNVSRLQNRLCQECLDKILESLEYDKWKNEKKEAVPLCLVDFQTLEIYSLQKISHKYYIDDYYVNCKNDNNYVQVEVIVTNLN